jgi:hypothetical protein
MMRESSHLAASAEVRELRPVWISRAAWVNGLPAIGGFRCGGP